MRATMTAADDGTAMVFSDIPMAGDAGNDDGDWRRDGSVVQRCSKVTAMFGNAGSMRDIGGDDGG